MNKTFSQGYRVITSYRNSKNYTTNWITAGYSLWFLREAKYLNNARMMLGNQLCHLRHRFLISNEIVRRYGRWKFHLLTEGHPVFHRQCNRRRKRLDIAEQRCYMTSSRKPSASRGPNGCVGPKGFYQVNWKYGKALITNLFHKKENTFACYDMLMTIAPASLVSLTCLAMNLAFLVTALLQPHYVSTMVVLAGKSVLFAFVNFYVIPLCDGCADHHHRVEAD